MHHYDLTVTPTFQGQGLTGTDRDGYENLMTRLGGTRSYTRRESKSKESMMQAEYTAKYSAAPSPQTVIMLKKSQTPTLDKGNTHLACT